MRSFFLVAVAVIFLVSPAQVVIAQSPEMPVPGAVLVDADGKPMAQVLGIWTNGFPVAILNFAGDTAVLPLSMADNAFRFDPVKLIYFQTNDCTGAAWVPERNSIEVLFGLQKSFAVTDPDADLGTYKVYRSTSLVPEVITAESRYNTGERTCQDSGAHYPTVLPAEEILPSPLEGFHGPTTANPERMLTIEGGTRLP